MKIQIVSDLHLEFHSGTTVDVLSRIVPPSNADVLVVAGDMGDVRRVRWGLKYLASRYQDVVYVAGNHEYYWTTREKFWSDLDPPTVGDNVHCLDNSHVTICGQRFVGSTLWFPDSPLARHKTKWMTDFRAIKGFDSWIWTEHERSKQYIWRTLRQGDVLVTHHLPTERSVSPKYQGEPTNCFFLGNIEGILHERKPAVAIHGHSHEPAAYRIGDTRVIANPYGYPMERRVPYVATGLEVDTPPSLGRMPVLSKRQMTP